jgi:hypothetical protein
VPIYEGQQAYREVMPGDTVVVIDFTGSSYHPHGYRWATTQGKVAIVISPRHIILESVTYRQHHLNGNINNSSVREREREVKLNSNCHIYIIHRSKPLA